MWRPTMAWSVRATRITQGRFHQDHNHRTCKLQLLGNKNEMCSSSILSEYVFANGKSPCSNHPEHNHKHTSILWKIQRKGRLFYKLMPLRQNIFHIPTIYSRSPRAIFIRIMIEVVSAPEKFKRV